MLRGKRKVKLIAMIVMVNLLAQLILPILSTEVFATEEVAEETETTEATEANQEITRNYEIKEEETWDVSANNDGSVMAKWTRSDRTIVISGTGEMKDWEYNSTEDWHDTQYTNAVEKVVIKEGITNIGNYAFYECNSLESVTILEDVTSIGSNAFGYCSGLTSIIIPEGVTSIEVYAFKGCSSLTNITIPETVTKISYSTFEGCSSLINITIPKRVTYIESFAFEGCSNLNNIIVDENNTNYMDENGILFSKDKKEIIKYPAGKKDVTEYNIPEDVINIDDGAFEGCVNLKVITIPNGVIKVGSSAFSGCSNLKNITIPEGVKYIHALTFSKCSNLEAITISERVKDIGMSAFSECSSLVNIEIPEGVTSIEDFAFEGCSNLTSITIPEEVTSIGKDVFSECSSLTSIIIPSSVTTIGECAIPKLTIIYAKADSEGHRYAEEAEQGYILEGEASNLTTNYEIKKEETWDVSENNDGSVMAKWTRSNRTIVISGTGKMKDWTSSSKENWHNNQYANAVENVVIEEGVTNIGDRAFYGCSNLTNIIIPEDVTSIGSNAFGYCSNLASITIPEGVTSIGASAFSECSSLGSIIIPEDVTSIGSNAFEYCSNLASITIPEGVTSIGASAFYRCSNLISITIPEGVTSIGASAFSGCSSLGSIIIPEGVTSIGGFAFSGCSSLTSITIPEAVTSIKDTAFNKCGALENIIVDVNNKKYMDENGILFSKDKKEIKKYPEGKRNSITYTIPEGVTSIGSYAFYKCSSLINIEIPEGVTDIGENTFYGCSTLKNITIPEKVTYIGGFTFFGCTSLKDITIPEGITSIGGDAFTLCTSLKSITIPSSVTTIKYYAIDKSIIIYTKDNSEGHRYAEEGKQGYIIDDIAPSIGYTPNKGEIAQKKYEVTVNIEDNEEGVGIDEKSLKYQWTQSQEEPTEENFTQMFVNGGTISKDDGDGEWYLWTIAKDKVGNTTIKSTEEFIFDNTGPIAEVKYSITELTNQDIEVTIKANEKLQKVEGWRLSEDKMSLNKTYTKNKKEEITIKDILGNETVVNIEISNIDKESPTADVKYNITELTNKDVEVTIISNEKLQEVEGWTLSEDKLKLTKQYSTNKEETITIKDLAGNESQVNIKITNIDKVAPTCKVAYSTNQSTKENVIVTITSNEQMQEMQGWTLSQDKLKLTKQYSDNKEEELILKDLAGNESKVSIKITNIDKIAPTCKIEYSTTQPTQENVTVTITANEQIQETEGWTLSQDKLKLTKKYTENVEEKITIKDVLGNITTVNIKISNIDKESPTADVKYSITEATNKDIEVTITSNEKLQELKGWTLSQDKLKLTKTYTKNVEEKITIKDIAGNTTTVNVKISNIDKTIPDITRGDINKDGQINTVDMIKILRHIAVTKNQETEEKNPTWKLTGELFTIADINEDGQVNTIDLLKALRHMSAIKDTETEEKHPDWILK